MEIAFFQVNLDAFFASLNLLFKSKFASLGVWQADVLCFDFANVCLAFPPPNLQCSLLDLYWGFFELSLRIYDTCLQASLSWKEAGESSSVFVTVFRSFYLILVSVIVSTLLSVLLCSLFQMLVFTLQDKLGHEKC